MDDNAYILGYGAGVDAGREEVIDWLEAQGDFEGYLSGYLEISLVTLKVKKKEWGLE